MTEDYFWGVTLDKGKKTDVWDPDVRHDSNSSHVFRGEHTLLVKQVVLGPEVPDGEVNVVEVEAMGYKSDVKFPIAVMKGGSDRRQCVLDLLFPDPPVTLKLVKGNGPVHILGNHSVGRVSNDGMPDEEEDELDEFEEEGGLAEEGDEDEEDIEDENNSVEEKKRKLPLNTNSKGSAGSKRPKIDNETD